MKKNYILAMILSVVVFGGFYFYQEKFVNPKLEAQRLEAEKKAEEEKQAAAVVENESEAEIKEVESSEEEVIEQVEEKFEITTEKLKVSFTNKGGDITSIELIDHKDNKTKSFVQMAENVSDKNRAFSLAFGANNADAIDDYFIVKQFPKDEKGITKIAFAKKYKEFTLVKQYSFLENEYAFKLDVIIDGQDEFKGLSFDGIEGTKVAYTLRSSPQIGPLYDPKVDRYENRTFLAHDGKKFKKVQLSDKQYKKYGKEISWAGIGGKYFCELIYAPNYENIQDVWYSTPKTNFALSNAQIFVERKAVTEKRTNDVYYVYVGPRNENDLKVYSIADQNGWKLKDTKIIDALQSSTFLPWLVNFFKWVLQTIYKFVPNWGVAIIIMTVLLKIVLFPLTLKSSMGTLKMQEIQPRMNAIQTKYKDNPQKLQEETAKLYKETGYNPMSGCLPLVFQMMALIAVFNLFNNYFEFRGAGFIKGWIDDLSSGDCILTWNTDLPFVGNCLRILPIIYLFSQLFYGKITQMGGAGAGAAANPGTMKFMTYGLPILFSFMFYNAPSGLLLFWTISNLIQMVQQLVINKVMAKKKAEANPEIKKFPKKGKRR
ncbi:MAG: membrane protein insertase YidC [Treponema sp.]|uniref:membrane protein insertase YidC n=1 Tax=Treponema sp. TaxID=166 RepID=UPI001B42FC49|nr:membrane protein insertase YidC [Treponema sp.]MBP5402076.1 membrane protein insertase YidC [Treponema sp.]MBR5933409.1 membrane protein insertase YidC [Treponema sp.]